MGGEVYADLLFLVNFSMDFLCYYLCARLLRRPLSLWRGIAASALGGIYAVAVLFLYADRVPAFLLDVIVCFVLCSVAMAGRQETLRAMLRLTGLYLLISMLLGGVMTALFAQLNRIPHLTDTVAKEGLSTWIFLIIAALSAILTSLWGRSLRRSALLHRVQLVIEEQGRRIELPALCDSGNLLKDPLSGRAVIPTEQRRLSGIVPAPILRAATQERVTEAVSELPTELQARVRLVIARGATGEKLLLAWQPSRLYRKDSHGMHEVQGLIAPIRLEQQRDIAALVPSEWVP